MGVIWQGPEEPKPRTATQERDRILKIVGYAIDAARVEKEIQTVLRLQAVKRMIEKD